MYSVYDVYDVCTTAAPTVWHTGNDTFWKQRCHNTCRNLRKNAVQSQYKRGALSVVPVFPSTEQVQCAHYPPVIGSLITVYLCRLIFSPLIRVLRKSLTNWESCIAYCARNTLVISQKTYECTNPAPWTWARESDPDVAVAMKSWFSRIAFTSSRRTRSDLDHCC